MIDAVLVGRRSLFVDLLTSFLRSRGLEITWAAPTPDACSSAVARASPRLCLVDARDVDQKRIPSLVAAAAGAGRGARVVVVSRADSPEAVEAARHAGAVGYLHSSTGIEGLGEALDRVLAGRHVTYRPRTTAARGRARTHDIHRLAAALTGRERECLSLLVEGLGTPELAARLAISELTVRSHVQAVLYKLGAHTRLEAASLAVRYDLHHGSGPTSATAGVRALG